MRQKQDMFSKYVLKITSNRFEFIAKQFCTRREQNITQILNTEKYSLIQVALAFVMKTSFEGEPGAAKIEDLCARIRYFLCIYFDDQ